MTGGIRLSMRKHANGLQPVTDYDWSQFDLIRTKKGVDCEVFHHRNPRHNAKMWVIFHEVANNSDDFNDAQEVCDWVKAELRMVEYVRSWGDSAVVRLKSINFAQMDQTRFNNFYDRAMWRLGLLLGFDPETLLPERDEDL